MIFFINLIAASIILFCGISSINKMGRDTSHGSRIAWLALTTGALGVLVAPIYGYPTLGWETVLNIGIAIHVVFERRRKSIAAAAGELT